MTRKVVVVGDNLISLAIANAFARRSADFSVHLFTSRGQSTNGLKSINCNLTDTSKVDSLFEEIRPNVVIHCAEEKDLDVCENYKEQAEQLNVKSVEIVAQAAKKYHSWFLYISSAFVFDGTRGPYLSNAPTNPVNEYGRMKVEAEKIVWKIHHDAGVLRIPYHIFSRDLNAFGNVLGYLRKLLIEQRPTTLNDSHRIYPTPAEDIGEVCVGLSIRKVEHCGLYGTWNYSSKQSFSMYSLAVELANQTGLSHEHITPQSSPNIGTRFKTPHDPQLNPIVLDMMGLFLDDYVSPTIQEVVVR